MLTTWSSKRAFIPIFFYSGYPCSYLPGTIHLFAYFCLQAMKTILMFAVSFSFFSTHYLKKWKWYCPNHESKCTYMSVMWTNFFENAHVFTIWNKSSFAYSYSTSSHGGKIRLTIYFFRALSMAKNFFYTISFQHFLDHRNPDLHIVEQSGK